VTDIQTFSKERLLQMKALMNGEGRHFQEGDYDSDDDTYGKKYKLGD